jgi:hypothetical protein
MEGFKNNSMLIEQYSVDVSVRCEGIDWDGFMNTISSSVLNILKPSSNFTYHQV